MFKSGCVVKLTPHNVRSDFDTVDFITHKTELMHVMLLLLVWPPLGGSWDRYWWSRSGADSDPQTITVAKLHKVEIWEWICDQISADGL